MIIVYDTSSVFKTNRITIENDHEKDTYTSYFSLFFVGNSPTEGQPGTRISFPQAYRLATT